MTIAKLHKLLNPESIAVVGASDAKGTVGESLMKNILSGFKGTVYPVNIKRDSVFGIRAYHSISEIAGSIDLAIIATPAVTVPGIVEECGKKGVCGVVIISAGFAEAGEEGHKMASAMLETAKKYNLRIIGPNCLGYINPHHNLNASFAAKEASQGRIAFVSQSGALCTAVLDWASENSVGFSYFVSIGSMIDVTFEDLIEYFSNDENTKSIIFYMESLNNVKAFLKAAKECAKKKPIFVLKVGRSTAGAKAALSHTGSLAGDDDAFNAAFERAGIIRINTIRDMFNCAQMLSMEDKPIGENLLIITNAGGPGVISTDYVMQEEGTMAKLSKQTYDALNSLLPTAWSHGNPVDILGDADPERYRKAAEICMKDKNVDAAVVILTPQAMTVPTEVAVKIVEESKNYSKPVIGAWMGHKDVLEGRRVLRTGSLPAYETPEEAIGSYIELCRYERRKQELIRDKARYELPWFKPKYAESRKMIDSIMGKGRFTLTEEEAKIFVANYGIPSALNRVAKNETMAAKYSSELGYPVVMKIASPDILHKTDIGGVKLGIKSKDEATSAFRAIIAAAKKNAPKARIEGVLIEKMVSKSHELLIGCKKDPLFGPVIVFGLGGTSVEVYKDTAIGLPPLNMQLAQKMLEKTKVYKLISGFRGSKGADIEELKKALCRFSRLLMDFPEIQELDINPFAVDDKGGLALDVKIVLDDKVDWKKKGKYSHLAIEP